MCVFQIKVAKVLENVEIAAKIAEFSLWRQVTLTFFFLLLSLQVDATMKNIKALKVNIEEMGVESTQVSVMRPSFKRIFEPLEQPTKAGETIFNGGGYYNQRNGQLASIPEDTMDSPVGGVVHKSQEIIEHQQLTKAANETLVEQCDSAYTSLTVCASTSVTPPSEDAAAKAAANAANNDNNNNTVAAGYQEPAPPLPQPTFLQSRTIPMQFQFPQYAYPAAQYFGQAWPQVEMQQPANHFLQPQMFVVSPPPQQLMQPQMIQQPMPIDYSAVQSLMPDASDLPGRWTNFSGILFNKNSKTTLSIDFFSQD